MGVVASLVRHALLRPWILAELVHGAFPPPPRPCACLERQGHPLSGFHSPSGCCRSVPLHGLPRRAAPGSCSSLSWSLVPYSDHQPKGSVSPRASNPGTMRLRSSAPLTPCSPSDLPTISGRVAPGISAFRALLLPVIRESFRTPSPPGVARPDRRTLAIWRIGPETRRGS
jgi:hypothetical protein